MTGALAGHSAALGRQGKRPASTLASTPALAQAPLHSAGISSKGKPGQEITLPWRPERGAIAQMEAYASHEALLGLTSPTSYHNVQSWALVLTSVCEGSVEESTLPSPGFDPPLL